MEQIVITPPAIYDPAHCALVREVCGSKMSEVTTTLRKTRATVRWFLGIFALPILLVLFAAYQFYIEAPLIYSTKAEAQVIDTRVIKMEEQMKLLPTSIQMKSIVMDAIKESRVP